MAEKRILQELEQWTRQPPLHCTGGPVSKDNLFHWVATIKGPPGSAYHKGNFSLSVRLPINYPNSPPKIWFKSPIYHPNISEDGTVYLDIIEHKWTPTMTISQALQAVVHLLLQPNIEDATQNKAAAMYRNNRLWFNRIARMWVRKNALLKE